MNNRVVVVTGAFGTLGRAVVARAFELEARVARIDIGTRGPEAIDTAASDRILDLEGVDLADSIAARSAMERIAGHFGGVDVLINVAGGFAWETVGGGDLATWDRLYTINLRTAVSACMAALPYLERSSSGAIVNVGAGAAVKAGLGMAAYAASKAGIAKLTESLAEEFKGRVTVNAVLPSIIDTPVNRADMPDADFSKWVSPAALADTMLYLAAGRSRAITGALLPVAGGV